MEMPSASGIVAGLLFSLVGIIGWRMGKRSGNPASMLIGAALIGYTFIVPDGWQVWAIGVGLSGALYGTKDWEI